MACAHSMVGFAAMMAQTGQSGKPLGAYTGIVAVDASVILAQMKRARIAASP
jgi:hypothetical protein